MMLLNRNENSIDEKLWNSNSQRFFSNICDGSQRVTEGLIFWYKFPSQLGKNKYRASTRFYSVSITLFHQYKTWGPFSEVILFMWHWYITFISDCKKTHFMNFQTKNLTLNSMTLGSRNYKICDVEISW